MRFVEQHPRTAAYVAVIVTLSFLLQVLEAAHLL